ncbi:ArsR/SmtB family transcription factor [Secundilactobacillus muriivasis]
MTNEQYVVALKAMADAKRLKIIDLLSCGTMCACDLLTHFDVTQPTLSHHMKVLETAGIVSSRKSGKWHYYTLRPEFIQQFKISTATLLDEQSDCQCHDESATCDNVI